MYIPTTTLAQSAGGLALIEDSLLGADTASFDFQSIPASYKHLTLIGDVRGAQATTQGEIRIRFNNDSGSNYDGQYYFILASAGTGGASSLSATSGLVGLTTANSATAGGSCAVRILVPNYASTTFNKNAKCETGYWRAVEATSPITITGAATWRSTAAVTRITIIPDTGNWLAGSRMSLYGVS